MHFAPATYHLPHFRALEPFPERGVLPTHTFGRCKSQIKTAMKKIIKRTALALVATPFVLLLLGAIIYFAYTLFAVGGESTQHQTYLKENMQEVTIGVNDFTVFDEAFYDSKVIMLGEVHGFAMPQELDFELLKHLNQKTGLTHYLAEVDYSQAYFLNQYLKTGDEGVLDEVFATWVRYNAQWANKEFYTKLQKIYTYNQTLPADKRISIVGVDMMQDIAVTKRHLHELLRKGQYTAGANAQLDTLTNLLSDSTSTSKSLQAFAASYLAATDNDSAYLPTAAASDIEHIFTNLEYQQKHIKRDSVMFLNLKNLSDAYQWQNKQFYGMWGLMHTLQQKVNDGFSSFAYLLKTQDSPFQNKVTTINIFASDSENMIPAGMMPASINKGKAYVNTLWVNSDGPLAFVNGIKDLKSVTKAHSMAIFKLNGVESPYHTSTLLATTRVLVPSQSGIHPTVEKPSITQLCQYAVLIRNSPATTPIKSTL